MVSLANMSVSFPVNFRILTFPVDITSKLHPISAQPSTTYIFSSEIQMIVVIIPFHIEDESNEWTYHL